MRASIFAAALAFLPLCRAQTIQIENVGGQEAAAREILIEPALGASSLLPALAQSLDPEIVQRVGNRGLLRVRSRSRGVDDLLRAVGRSPWVAWAEPNYILRATDTVPNDLYFPNLWGLQNTGQVINGQAGVPFADIGAARAWDTSTGSAGIVIGILDTGVDYTHPDLAANIWTAQAPFQISFNGSTISCPSGTHGLNFISLACDPLDDNAHGTHVAGIIGAQGNNLIGVAGVNWTTSIIAFKFLDQYGMGQVSDAVNAIEAAIQMKTSGVNIRVLNASWGGSSFSTPLQQAIAEANAHDILFVAAAGNGAWDDDITPTYPASFSTPNIIAVAATDNRDGLASFSNYGPQTVHLGAPGVNIQSTVLNDSYQFWSGTSMAAPFVSGAAALVLSKCSLDTAALKSDLLNGVDPEPALAGKTLTGGRVNVYRALLNCGALPVPDFTLSARPQFVNVQAGGSATVQVNLGLFNGFSTPVMLSATGLPPGVSASFSPLYLAGAGSSTLTLASAASTPSGKYAITIQGSGGTLTHSIVINLGVNLPDFTISASPASVSAPAGALASTTLSITGLNGFVGAVGLAALSLPAGVTALFSPASVTGSGTSNLNLTIAAAAAPGTYTLGIQAASGNLIHTVSVILSITPAPDFTLSIVPSATASLGSSAAVQVTVTALNGFAANVNLAAPSLPAGVTASFLPAVVPGSGVSTLSLQVASSVAPGSYVIPVRGTALGLTHTATVNLTINLGSIGLPANLRLNLGAPVVLPVSLSAAAPADGVFLTLTNSDPSTVGLNLAYSFIPAGQSTSTRIQVTGFKPGSASITASAPGMLPATVQVSVAGSIPLAITSISLNSGTVGVPYFQALSATGGVPPYTWSLSAGTLPASLSLNPATGVISGTPAVGAASISLTVRVADSSVPVQTASATLFLVISQPAVPASIVSFSGASQSAALNATFAAPLAVIVRDASGNPANQVMVNFAAPATGASATFPGGVNTAASLTNSSGIATSPALTANSIPGAYTVSAFVAGLPAAAGFALTNLSGSALGLPSGVVLNPGGQSSFTVSIPTAAPPGGIFIALASSDASTVSVFPPFILIPQGQTMSTAPKLTALKLGNANILASADGYLPAAALVQVVAPAAQ
ncbi:MAG TPA: S8 family serine peptidase [Bryobacteraceae bacterium]|nr:S8 family serine peptidase [Bryobacteraceae bacterium]